MHKLFFLWIFLSGGLLSNAQQQHTVSGTIKDQKTGEVLIGASVILLEQKGHGGISNDFGFFSLTAPRAEYTLVISFLGYENDTLHISLTKDITEAINLQPRESTLQAITVSGRNNDNIIRTLPGVQSLSVQEIKDVPV